MSPENAQCLTAAAIDCCVLVNNHVLDWDAAGMRSHQQTLQQLGIKATGAGRNDQEAGAPFHFSPRYVGEEGLPRRRLSRSSSLAPRPSERGPHGRSDLSGRGPTRVSQR